MKMLRVEERDERVEEPKSYLRKEVEEKGRETKNVTE